MQNIQDLQKMADTYQGMLILGIIPGSASFVAGVRRGDILMEVNGVRITNSNDYIAAPRNVDGKMDILIIRNHQEMRLTLDLGSAEPDPQSAMDYVLENQPILPPDPGDGEGTLH